VQQNLLMLCCLLPYCLQSVLHVVNILLLYCLLLLQAMLLQNLLLLSACIIFCMLF
jgi:hypothetical protein